MSQRPESLGTKDKFWVTPPASLSLPERLYLFKVGRPQTGENWAEKVSCEIAKALGLPCADYQLAVNGTERGVVSPRFMPESAHFFPGNMLLSRVVNEYDGSKRFRQIDYKLSRVLGLIRGMKALGSPIGFQDEDRLGPSGLFVGYLVLDILIGNTDRHHENWGLTLLVHGGSANMSLAPTFDHASSLGRNETPARRAFRLTTRDRRSDVEAYAQRGRSAFYGPDRTLTFIEMAGELARFHPVPFRFWAERVRMLTPEVLGGIFGKVNSDWIDRDAASFALRMLAANKSIIEESANA